MALVLISTAVIPGFINVPFPAMRIMEAETRLAQLNATAAILAVRAAELETLISERPAGKLEPPGSDGFFNALGFYSNPQTPSVIVPEDSQDPIPSRKITFTKKQSSTRLRLMYSDNLRFLGSGKRCAWELKVRDAGGNYVACKNAGNFNKIKQWFHNGDAGNEHQPHNVMGYCDGINAGDYQLTVSVSTSDNSDCYTGWSGLLADNVAGPKSQYFLEAQEMEPDSPTFHVANGGNSQVEYNKNAQQVAQRRLTFTKRESGSPLRILYHDNFRTHQAGAWCEWSILVDGKMCPGGQRLGGRIYHSAADNDHMSDTMIGVCTGVAAGEHTIGIESRGSTGGCYLGWANGEQAAIQVWTIEVDERPVPALDKYYHYVMGNSKTSNTNGLVPDRDLAFEKHLADSRLRIAYYDNLRIITAGSAGACSWNVLLCDSKGANCATCESGRVSGDMYNNEVGKNDHFFKVINGYCDNVPAGSYHLKVEAGSTAKFVGTSHDGNHDCYTGWESGTDGDHFHLEVLEVPQLYGA